MRRFTALDLQRHVRLVQDAALSGPVAITHHGHDRLVLMDVLQWRRLGRADGLAAAIRTLRANRAALRTEGMGRIAIFGSVARGESHAGSDIDLLVEPIAGFTVGGLTLVRWRDVLSGLLGCRADVVVPEFLSDQVAATIAADLVEAVAPPGEAANAL